MNPYFANALGLAAPYYNLALVLIVILLFLRLFRTRNKNAYTLPWKLLFFAVLVYVAEEIVTVIAATGLIHPPKVLFPVFEMIIITTFIYMLLLQKEYVSNPKKRK